jgi:hypothetical protein
LAFYPACIPQVKVRQTHISHVRSIIVVMDVTQLNIFVAHTYNQVFRPSGEIKNLGKLQIYPAVIFYLKIQLFVEIALIFYPVCNK